MKHFFALAMILVSFSLPAQFRLSSISVSNVEELTDSTYRADITFNNDLTGSGYYPAGIVAGQYVVTQLRGVYRVLETSNVGQESASVTMVEQDLPDLDTEGPPTNQLMIFNLTKAKKIPSIRLGPGGINVSLQEAISTYNSLVGGVGDQGDKGDDGDSAYEIWLSEGNAGSVGDFLLDITGAAGADGLGISNAEVNGQGELVITYTDASTANLGSIIGEQGLPGQDGSDGVSVTGVSVVDNELIIELSDATTISAGVIEPAAAAPPVRAFKQEPFQPVKTIVYDPDTSNFQIVLEGDIQINGFHSVPLGARGEFHLIMQTGNELISFVEGILEGDHYYKRTPDAVNRFTYTRYSDGLVIYRAPEGVIDSTGSVVSNGLVIKDPEAAVQIAEMRTIPDAGNVDPAIGFFPQYSGQNFYWSVPGSVRSWGRIFYTNTGGLHNVPDFRGNLRNGTVTTPGAANSLGLDNALSLLNQRIEATSVVISQQGYDTLAPRNSNTFYLTNIVEGVASRMYLGDLLIVDNVDPITVVPRTGSRTWIEDSGTAVAYGSDFDSLTVGAITNANGSDRLWVEETVNGVVGYRNNMDDRQLTGANHPDEGPVIYIPFNISTTGTYTPYILGEGAQNVNNSFWVSWDGSASSSVDFASSLSNTTPSPAWSSSGPSITVNTPGVYTLAVSAREVAVWVGRVYLTSAANPDDAAKLAAPQSTFEDQ